MKFALLNGSKVEASKAGKGICPVCGSELIAKCGEVNVNHWAHKGNHNCDPWWENETSWHRSWKDSFPIEWQEVVHSAENGEKHIADVKTDGGWVLEFQHSYLKPEERRARNAFYPKLVWIVDGTRRPTDKIQFDNKITESQANSKSLPLLRIIFPEECRLLKEWHDNNAFVFFDFQETKEADQAKLWFLLPKVLDVETCIFPIPRHYFIEEIKANKFDKIVGAIKKHLDIQKIKEMIKYNQSNGSNNIKRDMAIMRERQRRFRF